MSEQHTVQLEDLGRLIFAKRKGERLTLEEAARQCEVSTATLWRLEQQWKNPEKITRPSPEPDTRTLGAVTRWIGISIEKVVSAPQQHESANRQIGTTADIVEAHLRADKNLDSQAAAALGRIFRVAYEQMKTRKPSSDATSEE